MQWWLWDKCGGYLACGGPHRGARELSGWSASTQQGTSHPLALGTLEFLGVAWMKPLDDTRGWKKHGGSGTKPCVRDLLLGRSEVEASWSLCVRKFQTSLKTFSCLSSSSDILPRRCFLPSLLQLFMRLGEQGYRRARCPMQGHPSAVAGSKCHLQNHVRGSRTTSQRRPQLL